jgi:hypothetical protein
MFKIWNKLDLESDFVLRVIENDINVGVKKKKQPTCSVST